MQIFLDIITNKVLLGAALSWLTAQFLKWALLLIVKRKLDFRMLLSSGGMPSSHSSTVCTLAIGVGRTAGFGSPVFALAAMFAFIVMYDASHVRLETGKQAKILNKMVRQLELRQKLDLEQKELKELVGHTQIEVMAGALLGILIGILFSY